MKIFKWSGGLGNQIFYYFFYRYVQENSNDTLYILDDSITSKLGPQHSLEHAFGIKLPLLSQLMPKRTWDLYCKATDVQRTVPAPILLKQLGIGDFKVVADYRTGNVYYNDSEISFNVAEEISSIPYSSVNTESALADGDVYYFGSWIDARWYNKVKHLVQSELQFVPISDEYNSQMSRLLRASNTVAVHLRTYNHDGYLKTSLGDMQFASYTLPTKYWANAITKMRKHVANPTWVLFAPDLKWWEVRFSELGLTSQDTVILADGNRGDNSFRDIQLMSLCPNLIMANSSFSFASALLNTNPKKYVITPTTKLGEI